MTFDYPERLAALRWCRRRDRGRGLEGRLDQLGNRPNMIGDPERHRWRHPQRFMRAAEIVKRDMKGNGR